MVLAAREPPYRWDRNGWRSRRGSKTQALNRIDPGRMHDAHVVDAGYSLVIEAGYCVPLTMIRCARCAVRVWAGRRWPWGRYENRRSDPLRASLLTERAR